MVAVLGGAMTAELRVDGITIWEQTERTQLDQVIAAARISPDGRYRYYLRHMLVPDARIHPKPLVSIGLNPSTADAFRDDQTIRKDRGFASRWGCHQLIKLNVYAYRATKPADMWRAAKGGIDIVGPGNDVQIANVLEALNLWGGKLVVSWGNGIARRDDDHARSRQLAAMFAKFEVTPLCFGANANGSPMHELYMPYERELVRWVCP